MRRQNRGRMMMRNKYKNTFHFRFPLPFPFLFPFPLPLILPFPPIFPKPFLYFFRCHSLSFCRSHSHPFCHNHFTHFPVVISIHFPVVISIHFPVAIFNHLPNAIPSHVAIAFSLPFYHGHNNTTTHPHSQQNKTKIEYITFKIAIAVCFPVISQQLCRLRLAYHVVTVTDENQTKTETHIQMTYSIVSDCRKCSVHTDAYPHTLNVRKIDDTYGQHHMLWITSQCRTICACFVKCYRHLHTFMYWLHG